MGAGLASLLSAGASGPAFATAGTPLRRVVASEVTSLDPQRPTGSLTTEMAAELFTGLTTYDAVGRLGPGCAESWSSSPDGLTWTFRLRPKLTWSDGTALGSRDFVFALQRYLAPETGDMPPAPLVFTDSAAAKVADLVAEEGCGSAVALRRSSVCRRPMRARS